MADCMVAMSALAPGAPRSGGACPSAMSICLAAASGSHVGYVAAKLSRLFSILPCRLRDACAVHQPHPSEICSLSTIDIRTLM